MSDERIITAAIVTSGEKGDGQFLPELVAETQKNGVAVTAITGNRAYSGKKNLEFAESKNIDLYARLNPIIANGFRPADKEWDYNKDAGMFVCPAGHLSTRKSRQGKKNVGTNQVVAYYFDVEKCQHCPLQEGCYRPGAKSKTYSVSIKSKMHLDHLAFEETEEFKRQCKLRYKIEAKNAELKTKHGYGKSWAHDIQSMMLQGAMTIFCANLKRINKLIQEK